VAIGNIPSLAQVNSQAYQIALQYRSAAQQALAFQAYVNALGQSGLVALGFASADASALITQANYMATLAQVYEGTATQASLFNFQNALIALTGPS
jgi:hypothetical protein